MRSAAIPFNAELCFFSQEIRKDKVHEVSSFNAGKQLQKAVDESSNQKWKVQLSTAISTNDARAIDVKYHLSCWVQNVQRVKKKGFKNIHHTLEEANVSIVASDIEFVCLVCTLLQDGKVLNIMDLKSVYSRILRANDVPDIELSTHDIKEKITSHIDDVHFMKAKCRNESDHVFSTAVRDAAMEDAIAKAAFITCLTVPQFSEVQLLGRPSTHGHLKES